MAKTRTNQPNRSLTTILKSLGPGLLFAGAAVGVSHLVQSTKAGAEYGFALLGAVLLALLLKYPFFEFGTRYAMATGETLIDGYRKQGKWVMAIFVLMTVGTMFTIQAAVTIVTAGLAVYLFGFGLGAWAWSAIILAVCLLILLYGRYEVLDNLMKFIIILLTLSTILALASALFFGSDVPKTFETAAVFGWEKKHIIFLIALMGWMPAPIDLSVWSSIWALEKKKLNTDRSLSVALFDFNVGYIGTAILAVCFLTLGALVIYGSGETLSPKGGVFAGQLIGIYTASLGLWAKPLIAVAAFTTMFSTTLTCLDAFPRVLSRTSSVLFPQKTLGKDKILYWFWILVTVVGALILLGILQAQMGLMVKIATILSFLTAPFLAFINYRLIMSEQVPDEAKPPKWLIYLSWVGFVFLAGFSLLYLWYQFI